MSTQRPTADTHQTLPTNDEPETAPLMFATDNEVKIQGLFTAESDDSPR